MFFAPRGREEENCKVHACILQRINRMNTSYSIGVSRSSVGVSRSPGLELVRFLKRKGELIRVQSVRKLGGEMRS